jgi:hypothetical protein
MLTPTASDVTTAILEAPEDSEIFLTKTALELVEDSLNISSLYAFNYHCGAVGRSVNVLDTPGAPAVLVLDSDEFQYGCTDVNTGRRFLVGQFGLYLNSDSCECIMEDGEEYCNGECYSVTLDLLGGESFIKF